MEEGEEDSVYGPEVVFLNQLTLISPLHKYVGFIPFIDHGP
jgi:hypothetical protein